MLQTLPIAHLGKGCACKGIKAAKKEANEVVKDMKLAVEYTRGPNSGANTIQAAATQVWQGPYERFTPEEKA